MIEKKWPGETFVLLGSGPSLCAEDVEYVKGKARVIAINTAYQLCPWADVLFAADYAWWRWHHASTAGFPLRYRTKEDIKVPRKWNPEGVEQIPYLRWTNFQTQPGYLGTPATGHASSGYLAINLAWHLGAAKILLLGYDCCKDERGRYHFHSRHPNGIEPPLAEFAKAFLCIIKPLRQLGLAVINCSRRTVLNAFPRQPLREALC